MEKPCPAAPARTLVTYLRGGTSFLALVMERGATPRDLHPRHFDTKARQPAMHGQGKIQHENKVNGSCGFPEGCLLRIKFLWHFSGEPVLRLLGLVFQSYCLRNLLRTQLSLPSTATADIKYFCKSLLGDPCQGPGKLTTSSIVFNLNDRDLR